MLRERADVEGGDQADVIRRDIRRGHAAHFDGGPSKPREARHA
jgi:hypothetical protein